MITITKTVEFKRAEKGRKLMRKAKDALEPASLRGRIPRVSRLMALAIRFEWLIREGRVADQTSLAQYAHVSQPHISHVMGLLGLAPDIQEEILFLSLVVKGNDPIHEHMLRVVQRELNWKQQRKMWRAIRDAAGKSGEAARLSDEPSREK